MLDARGAFKKNPQRRRDGEPEVKEPIGQVPDSLNEGEAGCWRELVDAAPLGVFTRADRLSVEVAAKLLWESRTDFANMRDGRVSRLLAILGQFGMTPSERAKLSIEKPKDANPFAALD